MFYQGIRPAVNVGISVSRVGSAAQVKAMKQVSGSMKLDLAQYSEMAAFSQFSSDLDAATKKLLNRGARLTEMLKQPVYHPLSLEDEVIVLYAGSNGYLDELEISEISKFEHFIIEKMNKEHLPIMKEIREEKVLTGTLNEELQNILKTYVEEFKNTYRETNTLKEEKIA